MINVTVRVVYRAEYELTFYDVESVEEAQEAAENLTLYNARSIYAHHYIDESQRSCEVIGVETLD